MIKDKLKVSFISILLVLLLAPILFPMESYFQAMVIYALIGGALMLLVGVPATFLAGVVTKKIKRAIHLVNFIIHVLPALLVSIKMFTPVSTLFSMPYAGLPIFASTVFYVVDEVIYQKIDLKGRLAKGIFLIPVAVFLLFVGPSLFTGFSSHLTATQIKEKGSPEVALIFQGEEIPINSSYCWISDGDGCVYGTDPFPLPEEKVKNVKEITMTSPATLDFSFENSEGEPTIYAYYHDGKGFKEIEAAGNKINISNDIPEQAIKFVVKWDNNKMVKFFVGVRTGILTNGRTF
ncbi:hypothetical protein N5C46_16440 [Rossellomorea vietnamensis]|uniref:Uncharacterized protein n=1 Tax=Rossellomorea vietnamensis TaxID=218284 RepID=A0ACD4C4E5_9BACI|nr:hypothetical protein [Rossellomorea vietnamensis]UXH43269.1 hypothetical protein N5C46_16440 [Rossellomorea vietnamensis]